MDDSDVGNLNIDPDLIEQVLEGRAGKPGRANGSYGYSERARGRPPSGWRTSCSIKNGAQSRAYTAPGASRSRCPARWRKEPDYPPDPRQMHSTSWNGWN